MENIIYKNKEQDKVIDKELRASINLDIENFMNKNNLNISSSVRKNLEDTLEKAYFFNSNFKLENEVDKFNLVSNSSSLLEIMNIRSCGFKEAGNDLEFKDEIFGLNYDKFDAGKSLIFSYCQDNKIVGTSRLIIDSKIGLLSENNYDLNNGYDDLRQNAILNGGKRIAELSRTVILKDYQKSNAFKTLMKGVYLASLQLNVGTLITAVRNRDVSMYERFGMQIIKELDYGSIKDCSILAWNIPEDTSVLFRRGILKENVIENLK